MSGTGAPPNRLTGEGNIDFPLNETPETALDSGADPIEVWENEGGAPSSGLQVAPVSRTAVEGLADSYRGQLNSEGPRTVARLETPAGAFNGRSGYSGGPHTVAQQLVDAKPARFSGACAECDAVSQALRAAETRTGQPITTVEQAHQALSGSSVQTARVRGPNSTAHGTPMPPCETCQPLLNALGILYR